MKPVIILIFNFFILLPSGFRDQREDEKKNLFVIVYTPGEHWDTTKPAGDQRSMRYHSQHLSRLRKEGTILIGARYADKGMIVVRASSEQDARRIVETDSAVIGKLFSAEVHRYNVFYEGCVSK